MSERFSVGAEVGKDSMRVYVIDHGTFDHEIEHFEGEHAIEDAVAFCRAKNAEWDRILAEGVTF